MHFQMLDIFGDGSKFCENSDERMSHFAMKDLSPHTCRFPSAATRLQPSTLVNDLQSRSEDIVLPLWSCGKSVAIDVTIVSSFNLQLSSEFEHHRKKYFGRNIIVSVADDGQSSSLHSRWCLVYYINWISPRFGSRRWRVQIPLPTIFVKLLRYSVLRS